MNVWRQMIKVLILLLVVTNWSVRVSAKGCRTNRECKYVPEPHCGHGNCRRLECKCICKIGYMWNATAEDCMKKKKNILAPEESVSEYEDNMDYYVGNNEDIGAPVIVGIVTGLIIIGCWGFACHCVIVRRNMPRKQLSHEQEVAQPLDLLPIDKPSTPWIIEADYVTSTPIFASPLFQDEDERASAGATVEAVPLMQTPKNRFIFESGVGHFVKTPSNSNSYSQMDTGMQYACHAQKSGTSSCGEGVNNSQSSFAPLTSLISGASSGHHKIPPLNCAKCEPVTCVQSVISDAVSENNSFVTNSADVTSDLAVHSHACTFSTAPSDSLSTNTAVPSTVTSYEGCIVTSLVPKVTHISDNLPNTHAPSIYTSTLILAPLSKRAPTNSSRKATRVCYSGKAMTLKYIDKASMTGDHITDYEMARRQVQDPLPPQLCNNVSREKKCNIDLT